MFLFDVPVQHRERFLEAMAMVARADGAVTPKELVLLEAAREALSLAPVAFTALPPFEPASISEADGSTKERLVQSMLLMAVMDGAGAREESALIEQVAEALGVNDHRVKNLRQLAEGRVRAMWLDLTRRGYAREEFLRAAKEDGVRGLWATFAPILGLSTDAALADRYIAKGQLAPGTLGRAYFDFVNGHGLPFPGERKAVAERGVWHDLSHVLGGYDITPIDEALVVSFIAGYRKEDPFFWLFTIALQFQVGIRISPFSPGLVDRIEPRAFVLHHRRGSLVKKDLSTQWHFDDDWERPLAELRAELGVVPIDAVSLAG